MLYTKICKNNHVIDLYHAVLQFEDVMCQKPVGVTYGEIIDKLLTLDVYAGVRPERTMSTLNNIAFYPMLTYRREEGYNGIEYREYLYMHSSQQDAIDEAITDGLKIIIEKNISRDNDGQQPSNPQT